MVYSVPKMSAPLLGHSVIDRDHNELVQLMSQLSSLIEVRTEDETIIKLLLLLIEKATIHFKTEEEFLDSLIENGIDTHDIATYKLQHAETLEAMQRSVEVLKAEIAAYKEHFALAIGAWSEHLFEFDKELVDHLNTLNERKSI